MQNRRTEQVDIDGHYWTTVQGWALRTGHMADESAEVDSVGLHNIGLDMKNGGGHC